MNRFSGCKTWNDLYVVFESEDVVDYTSLTAEELERVALVFDANRPDDIDMPDVPLTEAGYTFVWNVVTDVIETIMKEENTMTNANTTTNGAQGTGFEDIRKIFNETKQSFVKNVTTTANRTKEQYVQQVDESFNTVKGAVVGIAGKLSDIIGYKALEQDILGIIEAGGEHRDLGLMAEDIVKRIDNEVELLMAWGDEESLKKAMELKAATETERGKNIFESLISGLIWGVKWVAKKLRHLFQVDNEKSLIGAVCRSLAGIVAVLREGVKLVWHTGKFLASFVIAGAIKLGAWVFNTVKSVIEKAKNWVTKKDEVIDEEDFEVEDFEDEFEAEEIQ